MDYPCIPANNTYYIYSLPSKSFIFFLLSISPFLYISLYLSFSFLFFSSSLLSIYYVSKVPCYLSIANLVLPASTLLLPFPYILHLMRPTYRVNWIVYVIYTSIPLPYSLHCSVVLSALHVCVCVIIDRGERMKGNRYLKIEMTQMSTNDTQILITILTFI